jgi:hypothetical protein
MQGLQRDLPTFVVIIAVVAFLAGLCCERIRAGMARRAWQNRRWGRGGVAPLKTWGREGGVSCCRFHGHRVKVDQGTGDWRWYGDGLTELSSSRR